MAALVEPMHNYVANYATSAANGNQALRSKLGKREIETDYVCGCVCGWVCGCGCGCVGVREIERGRKLG